MQRQFDQQSEVGHIGRGHERVHKIRVIKAARKAIGLDLTSGKKGTNQCVLSHDEASFDAVETACERFFDRLLPKDACQKACLSTSYCNFSCSLSA